MNRDGFKRRLQRELGTKAQVLEVRIDMNPARTAYIVRMLVKCRGETEPVLFRKAVMFGVTLDGIPKDCADEISRLRNLTEPQLEKVNLETAVTP